MDVPPTLERKPFVCSGADELVPECESAVSRLADELVQRVPPAGIADVGDLAFEDLGEKAGLEGGADDCGAPEQHAVRRMKCVDACGEKALHGVRQRLETLAAAGGVNQLAHEQWVSTRALGYCIDRLGRQRKLLGDRQRELRRTRHVERLEIDPLARALGMDGSLLVRTRRDAE